MIGAGERSTMAELAEPSPRPVPRSETTQRVRLRHATPHQALSQAAELLNARPAVAAQRALAEQLSAAKPAYSGVVMRRVNPDFNTFRGPAAGPATKPEMQSFYDRFVGHEVARFTARPIDTDVKDAMTHADLMFTLFMLNSPAPVEVHAKLDALIVAVNASAANWDAQLGRRPPAAGEVSHRRERERREGAIHSAGVTKEMPLRGVDSRDEAHQLLTSLQAALNGALGGNYPLGQLGIRGSAVTGIRTRTRTAFEQGTGQYQDVSDASDLDFFFTCPALEAKIRQTQDLLPEGRGLNAGGTMNAQYLNRWLTNCPAPGNRYPHAAALAAALTTFSTNATARTGRKCDVTFIGKPTADGLANDAGTLIF